VDTGRILPQPLRVGWDYNGAAIKSDGLFDSPGNLALRELVRVVNREYELEFPQQLALQRVGDNVSKEAGGIGAVREALLLILDLPNEGGG
jgi:hypothetical protein